MIYTVTLNASLDYIVSVEDFRAGYTNRTVSEQIFPGGKGINVSLLLTELGFENVALGFIAGFTGDEIKKQVELRGCLQNFITLPHGLSRINVKLKSIDGTEINGRGPHIAKTDLQKLFSQLSRLKKGDVLVLAGSIPSSVPDSIYRDILEFLAEREVLTVVDATGDLLINVLAYHPFLIKPNIHELGELFDTVLTSRKQAIPYARKLQAMGAQNVLVSLAGAGAVLVDAHGTVHESCAPKGMLKNGVGAGDSMVAGFLAGWLEQENYRYAFRMGLAAGSASAFSETMATRSEIKNVLQQLEEIAQRRKTP
ncbi:MAG TPA: 1-phosphofructokinase [Lachnospiraceae bacterium]|nr:1-phosphofructokinase [Lachnospiraceae bacterium]